MTITSALLVLALATGLALRTYQLTAGTPLWIDELGLVSGTLAGPFAELFDGPSDFSQAGPPGFLAMQWVLHRLVRCVGGGFRRGRSGAQDRAGTSP